MNETNGGKKHEEIFSIIINRATIVARTGRGLQPGVYVDDAIRSIPW